MSCQGGMRVQMHLEAGQSTVVRGGSRFMGLAGVGMQWLEAGT